MSRSAQPGGEHAARQLEVAHLAVLVGVLGLGEGAHGHGVSCGAWVTRSLPRWSAFMPRNQSTASDRVVAVDDVQRLVDDLPQCRDERARVRTLQRMKLRRRNIARGRRRGTPGHRYSQSYTGGQDTTRSMRGSRPAARNAQ